MLGKYRARAVAKEAQLVARREEQLRELKMQVAQRIEAKNYGLREPKQVDTY